jgi:hypothetical protein
VFSKIFDGGLTGTPYLLGEVSSNVFIVEGVDAELWAKVRIGIYTQVSGLGLVEVGNVYVPVGDSRLIMGIIKTPVKSLLEPLLAFAEVVYRYPRSNPFVCRIYCGDVEDMIFDQISSSVIADANATKNETSSDIINTSNAAVSSVKAANPLRAGGFMEWKGNGSIYIGFGGAPARKDTSKLIKGSRIEIPPNFVGEIFVDWNGNQVAPTVPPDQFKTLLCIEYLR